MAPVGTPDLPWAERHRPKHLGQVVGNTDQVRKLAEWLRDWDEVVLKGHTKQQEQKKEDAWRTFKPVVENINARAALISGPPGIGKTTTCSLVARCNKKYKLMEFNASDARGKAIIEQMSNSLAGNHTLNLSGKGGAIERAVIIMDECDGMAGGGDKGGMQALINMIKATKNPIICICNDRGDQQVRNLAPNCFDIKFKKPENSLVAKRVKGILEREGTKVDLGAVEAVVEACGHDIRQVLNHVQFFGAARGQSNKDAQVALSPFDACTQLLSPPEPGKQIWPLEKRLDLFYIDADFVPLMLQENYLKPFEKQGASVEENELERCAKAAELISTADSWSGHWELMSSAAIVGTIYPAFLTTTKEGLARPAFPAWMQRRSAMTKAERQLQDVHARIKGSTSCGSREFVTSSFHELLHTRLLRPLQVGSVKDCAAALAAYGLNRDFFMEQAPTLRTPLQLEDNYKKVDIKMKSMLLQELQELERKEAVVTKRKKQEGEGPARRKSRGPGEDAAEAEGMDDEGGEGKGTKAKKAADKVKTVKGKTTSKSSLKAWRVESATETQEAASLANKKATLIMRYVDGHTNAVRRKVYLGDLLGPWVLF